MLTLLICGFVSSGCVDSRMTKSIGLPLCLVFAVALAGAPAFVSITAAAAGRSQVQIPGMPGVRTWGDEFSPVFQQDMIESIRQEERSGLFKEGF